MASKACQIFHESFTGKVFLVRGAQPYIRGVRTIIVAEYPEDGYKAAEIPASELRHGKIFHPRGNRDIAASWVAQNFCGRSDFTGGPISYHEIL